MADSIGTKLPPGFNPSLLTNTAPKPAGTEVPGAATGQPVPGTPWATPGAQAPSDATSFKNSSGTPAPTWLPIPGDGRDSILGAGISSGLRYLTGALKEIPLVGNLANLADTGIDAAWMAGALLTGKGTTAERMKWSTDLVQHARGIFNTNVGAEYDRGQAALRFQMNLAETVAGNSLSPELRQWAPALVAGYGVAKQQFPGKTPPAWMITAGYTGANFVLPRLGNLFGKGG